MVITGFLLFMSLGTSATAGGLYENSVGLTNGLYSAAGFGTNYYFGMRYTHYFSRWTYFVDGIIGFSSVKSKVLKDIANFQVFDNEELFTYEFLFGYDPAPLGSFPFFLVGVAGVQQGGVNKFAYVVGLGKQIPFARFSNIKRLGFRYDIRDQLFKQTINNNTPFLTHNLLFTVGIHYYF